MRPHPPHPARPQLLTMKRLCLTPTYYRLERLQSERPPWYAPTDEPPVCLWEPCSSPENTPARSVTISYRIYIRWRCLNPECTGFSRFSDGRLTNWDTIKYDPLFLQRKPDFSGIPKLDSFRPEDFELGTGQDVSLSITAAANRGIACEKCNGCIIRRKMTVGAWTCEAQNVDIFATLYEIFSHQDFWIMANGGLHQVMVKASSATLWVNSSWNSPKNSNAIIGIEYAFDGHCSYRRYTFAGPNGSVVHISPNRTVLASDGGADSIMDGIQRAELPMQRRYLKTQIGTCSTYGESADRR